MSKHTPGPWSTNPDGSIVWNTGGVQLFHTLCTPETQSEARANAQLIAAAPDLLMAAIMVATDLENAVGNRLTMAQCLRDAIAKAKGE
jgi:hypothetical protein